jgi:TRAP transporter TAXI family solute receptor
VEGYTHAITKYSSGITATNVETGATYDNLRQLTRGELQIGGIVSTPGVYELYNGMAPFTAPNRDLRWMNFYSICFYGTFVRAELPIYNVVDLAGKKFALGGAGTDCNIQTGREMEVLGIDVKNYVGSTSEQTAAMKDRRIVGYAKPQASLYRLDGGTMDINTSVKLRAIGMTEEQMNAVKAKYPQVPFTYIKKGQVKELPEAGGFWNVLSLSGAITDTKLSQEAVYRIMKSVFGAVDDISAGFPGFREVADPAFNLQMYIDLGEGMPPLHAGAVQFYKEKGVAIPQRLIPPEYVG